MMRIRGSPNISVSVAIAIISLFMLIAWTNENDTTDQMSNNDDVGMTDSLDTNTTPQLATPLTVEPNLAALGQVPEDANAIAEKVAGRNTKRATYDQICDAANTTTRLTMWRTDDGKRSNAPPMNDALALIIPPTTWSTADVVRNC